MFSTSIPTPAELASDSEFAQRLRSRGWDVSVTDHFLQFMRVVGGLRQRGELRPTQLGGWDLYQRVTPAHRIAPLPAAAILACPRKIDFDWNVALHALDTCLLAALLSI
jgi:hypothetical protein